MTATATGPLIETTDEGVIPFPSYCPRWCDRAQHLEFVAENPGILDAAEATAHRRHGGDRGLPEIRNGVGEVARDRGASWSLDAIQRLMEFEDVRRGYAHQPHVTLQVSDKGVSRSCTIEMTTGEARVLVANIAALCDRVDLAQ